MPRQSNIQDGALKRGEEKKMRNKMLFVVSVLIASTCIGIESPEYIFSCDKKVAVGNPRKLPNNGRDFQTGNVVSNLSSQSVSTLVKCGWYKVIVPPYELGMLQYGEIAGYTFDTNEGTATAIVNIRDGAPVKKYTQYKVIGVLTKMGKWNDVKKFLETNNLFDMFMAAQYLATDDPNFFAAKKQMAKLLGISDAELDVVLEACIDK
jgi:hypothetical protein